MVQIKSSVRAHYSEFLDSNSIRLPIAIFRTIGQRKQLRHNPLTCKNPEPWLLLSIKSAILCIFNAINQSILV